MKSTNETSAKKSRKVMLSTLWIFVTVNYIFCDVLSHMEPEFLKLLIDGGTLLGSPINQKFLLWSAIFMEIPFAMILLSRILNYRASRLMNIIAGTIMTIAQIASLFVGPPSLHYIFYSIIEIGCTIFIVWYAWTWRNIEDSPDNTTN